MRFEARELKPYAEPVPAAELKEGMAYFSVEFVDSAMHLPRLEPVVFIGRDLCPGDAGQVYFQDAASYLRGTRYHANNEPSDAEFFQCPEGQTKHIFNYEQALDEMMSCSLRRKGVGGTM